MHQATMDRWNGKVALVIGASTGIGLTIAKTLFKKGMIVVGVARRKELMEDEMRNIEGEGKFFALKCDVTKEEDVLQIFEWIKKNLGCVHVLINNAGAPGSEQGSEETNETWDEVMSVNVLGVLYCCKQAIKMLQQSGEEGHIMNMNSVDGHRVIQNDLLTSKLHTASRHALTALTTTLELELIGSKIRITSITPGYVNTTTMRKLGLDKLIQTELNNPPFLEEQDVADAIVYVLGTHPRVQITELTIKPLGDTF